MLFRAPGVKKRFTVVNAVLVPDNHEDGARRARSRGEKRRRISCD